MITVIRLHPADCEKYGAPEEVRFDFATVGIRQRGAFERSPIGPRKSFSWFEDQLQGVPELDEAGNPIPVPVIDPKTGEQELDEAGKPKVTPKLTRDPDVIAMYIWLALWGAGIKVPWDTFDPRVVGLQMDVEDDEDEADQGKAEAAETGSESTTTAP